MIAVSLQGQSFNTTYSGWNVKCTTVNGVEGACDLSLDQFAFAGTHNSGSGAFGYLYHYHICTKASSAGFRNQYKSITEQLNAGIRYFDFDVSYVTEKGKCWWWVEGLTLVHGGAYAGSFAKAMEEIDEYMSKNSDAVVVVRIKDVVKTEEPLVKTKLAQFIGDKFKPPVNSSPAFHVKLNPKGHKLGTLKDAVDNNERLFLYVTSGIFSSTYSDYMHKLSQVETQEAGTKTRLTLLAASILLPPVASGMDCATRASNIIAKIASAGEKPYKRMSQNGGKGIQIDWLLQYQSYSCNKLISWGLTEVQKVMHDKYDRSFQYAFIDDHDDGSQALNTLVSTIKEINEANVAHFLGGVGKAVAKCKTQLDCPSAVQVCHNKICVHTTPLRCGGQVSQGYTCDECNGITLKARRTCQLTQFTMPGICSDGSCSYDHIPTPSIYQKKVAHVAPRAWLRLSDFIGMYRFDNADINMTLTVTGGILRNTTTSVETLANVPLDFIADNGYWPMWQKLKSLKFKSDDEGEFTLTVDAAASKAGFTPSPPVQKKFKISVYATCLPVSTKVATKCNCDKLKRETKSCEIGQVCDRTTAPKCIDPAIIR